MQESEIEQAESGVVAEQGAVPAEGEKEEKQTVAAEQAQGGSKVWIWLLIGIFALIVIFVLMNTETQKVEVLEEAKMTMSFSNSGYYPTVKAKVKNITDGEITVELRCSIYDADGSVSDNLSSPFVRLGAGETAWLTASSYYTYSLTGYYLQCASFGNVEYRIY